jgi:hypothetical protein
MESAAKGESYIRTVMNFPGIPFFGTVTYILPDVRIPSVVCLDDD